MVLFILLASVYLYLSVTMVEPYVENGTSYYEYLLNKYFPFFSTIIISFYIRYEIEKTKKLVNSLENNVNTYHNKVKKLLHMGARIRKEKNDMEKRLISEERESIKIREIMGEINDFNIQKIHDNMLNYFKRLIPSAEMRFLRLEEDTLQYVDSTYKSLNQESISRGELYNYVMKREEDISSSLDYEDRFQEKIIITLRLGKNSVYGVILVDDIDFLALNRVTIQGLYYFVELLSLQIEKTIIYQKQKETSYSYNDKNVYNIKFLKKIVSHTLNTAKRHELNSSVIITMSSDFTADNEDLVFEDIENLYTKHLRKTDMLFYNHENGSFVFLFPITSIDRIQFIKEKIHANLQNYYLNSKSTRDQ